MLPFCVGGFLFYLLFDKTGILTVAVLLGVDVPFFLYLPYAPFEFVVGIWLLVKKYDAEY